MSYESDFLDLSDLGLVTIPLHSRSKRPMDSQWGSKPLTIERVRMMERQGQDFNFGILLGSTGNGVVDIDLDDKGARILGPRFLPKTGRVFGRAAFPSSHHLYKIDATDQMKVAVWKDPTDASTLLELRGAGHQTLVPPSWYEEGEQAMWSAEGDIGTSDWVTLSKTGGLIAAYAWLAKHWHSWWGSIHDVSMALSGGLLRSGWSVERVQDLIKTACDMNNDTGTAIQMRTAADTDRKLKAGEEVTGWRTLAKLWDKKEVDTFRTWLGIESIGADFQANDRYNADIFIDLHGDNVRYDATAGQWLVWDGNIWRKDERGRVDFMATDVGPRIMAEASSAQDPDDIDKRMKWGIVSQNSKQIDAMLKRVRTHENVATIRADWQADPMLVALTDCTLNLNTLTTQDSVREDRITQTMGTTLKKGPQKTPLFDRLLNTAQPDPEMQEYLQRMVGYWLTGLTGEQLFWLFYGPTAGNGKSTFMAIIDALMGDYSQRAVIKSFLRNTRGGGEGPRQDLVLMDRAHLLITSEAPQGAAFDTTVLKDWTGSDPIRARGLYWRTEVEFVPRSKIVMPTNYLPKADAFDEGIWRRIEVFPWEVSLPKAKQIQDYHQAVIANELPGILNWALEGLHRYQAMKLTAKPEPVERYTSEYRESNNSVNNFIDDEAVLDKEPTSRVGRSDLYQAYVHWCKQSHVGPIAMGDFRTRLIQLGVEEVKVKGKRYYRGVRLIEDMLFATNSPI